MSFASFSPSIYLSLPHSLTLSVSLFLLPLGLSFCLACVSEIAQHIKFIFLAHKNGRKRDSERKAERGKGRERGSGKAVSEYANKMSLNNAKDKREQRQTKFNLIVYPTKERESASWYTLYFCAFACAVYPVILFAQFGVVCSIRTQFYSMSLGCLRRKKLDVALPSLS